MFGWFKKAPPDLPFTDRVYADQGARLRAILREALTSPALLVAPFAADEDTLAAALDAAGIVYTRIAETPTPWGSPDTALVRADRIGRVVGRAPAAARALVYGHFPLPSDGRALREALAAVVPAPPVVFSALDEPLMRRFGGDRTAELMRKLGLEPDEPVEHPFVTNAMAKARERVAEQVKVPREARSVEEWLTRNLG